MSESPPPFPRLCESPGYIPPTYCHGFFSGTMSNLVDGHFEMGPAPVAVIEDATGSVHVVHAQFVSFRK